MSRTFSLLRNAFLAVLTSAALVLAVPTTAWAQHSRGGGSRSGGDSSSGGSSSGGTGGHATSGGRSGSDGGGARSAPAPVSAPSGSDGRARAVPRGTTGTTGTSPRSGDTTASGTSDGAGETASAGSDSSGERSREGRAVRGRAVERPPYSAGGGTTVIVDRGYGGYYPWAWGGLGFGGNYGYYDPWWYDPYPPVYGGGGGYYREDGSLRLKVKPRDASVYVDGYFAGRVDDFDGVFQKLRLESGPHRVELRLDGFESLSFDVRIDPDRKTTYTGALKRVP
jgi:PEGA domain-containing protein